MIIILVLGFLFFIGIFGFFVIMALFGVSKKLKKTRVKADNAISLGRISTDEANELIDFITKSSDLVESKMSEADKIRIEKLRQLRDVQGQQESQLRSAVQAMDS